MRIPRLFLPLPLHPGARVGLDERAARHARDVLRLAAGAEVVLFNGVGGDSVARLVQSDRRGVLAEVLAAQPAPASESPLDVRLYQGVARGEKMDFILQKAVELGVTHIAPLHTSRSVVRLDVARAAQRTQHWRGVVIAACEQCGRGRVPEVAPPVGLPEALAADRAPLRLLLDPAAAISLPRCAADIGGRSLSLYIGPEGGFSEEERELLRRCGAQAVQLGPRVLRTETAALAALAALQALCGDWR
jgi:16S rRNA (uracil1498-N3)-methyltransferase